MSLPASSGFHAQKIQTFEYSRELKSKISCSQVLEVFALKKKIISKKYLRGYRT